MEAVLAVEPRSLVRPDGERIAYHASPGKSPGVIFLSGYRSDMQGSKATALHDHCVTTGRACLRFDHFAHGQSSGDFLQGTIGRWKDDAIAVLDELASGPQILVGSSMGGWLACLAAAARPQRVAGLVLIAPAVDFTRELLWPNLPAAAVAALRRDGVWREPSQYSAEPYPITLRMIEDGDANLLLPEGIPYMGPVRILQGQCDPDVPWRHALRVAEAFAADDVRVTLFKNGDHRLSAPPEIAALLAAVDELAAGQDRP